MPADDRPSPAPTPTEGPAAAVPEPADDLVVTHHELGSGPDALRYTATTGRVVLREEVVEDGRSRGVQPRAQLFSTSYVLDGADPATRPVTFAFNGGPGSSSVWLHMGLLGPRRVVMGDAGDLAPPPYALADNLQTLLRVSDLVFIDPVSTGYSRTHEGHTADDFHGFTRDVESVGEFIRLWTSRNGRWLSPKFLAGESYGTTRAAALAGHLATGCGMYVNGLVLISSVLDIGSVDFEPGSDLGYALYLPTYTAAAHFHGRVDGELRARVAEAEEFAARELPWALGRGSRLTGEERSAVVARYAELTGLSPGYVDRADLRVDLFAFTAELLREERTLIGRLDMRFTGWLADPNDARMTGHDPSSAAIMGPYSATLNAYLRGELGYASDLTYNVLTPKVHPWSYKEFEGRSVEATGALTTAMQANPHMRVHIACGWYDGATPHFAAEHVMAHLRVPPAALDRVEWAYYEAGHMMYVHEPSRLQQSADLADFVTRAC
ncbi:peptidase S10 [Modestobacter sp. I12A-02628]|uniref:Peptidase S10 n=1 Tax=Goekera deserti TaxID=2497753 RepID=A0A7K3WCM4_9ACTN|nr:peptidase S10 [Goekera deserti]MPQ97035.1 peptidase S10 [Goekera deserti]NDI46649.1 peptidase S10 [Goekera deserti]NEL54218.1 peptidase S10 [Goekera deserti]